MPIWAPDLTSHAGPKYRRLASALSRDIENGTLSAGERLPPHRHLARALGVTVGTVSRAYSEAFRRGLVVGEVGRGTFVRGPRPRPTRYGLAHDADPALIDLSLNLPVSGSCDDALRKAIATIARAPEFTTLMDYQAVEGLPAHAAAGAQWIARTGWNVPPEEVVVTHGAQHAMLLAFSALARPGDTVLAEALTYPGMNSLARMLHLQVEGVGLDEHGIRPDLFEEACIRHRPKALYCMPTVQNPTASIMPLERRREIAAIATARDVVVVEDDTYGFHAEESPPPLGALMPASSIYLTTLSKSVTPGVRIGFIRAPLGFVEEIRSALMATMWMVSPLAAEIACRWIQDGTADAVAAWRRDEADARRELAKYILGPVAEGATADAGLHLWMTLPEPWRADDFVTQSRRKGVAVTSPEVFAVGRGATPHCVRVCLGAVSDRERLARGLELLAELLAASPPPGRHGI